MTASRSRAGPTSRPFTRLAEAGIVFVPENGSGVGIRLRRRAQISKNTTLSAVRFRHKGLEALFRTGSAKGLDAQLAGKLRRMLARLNDGLQRTRPIQRTGRKCVRRIAADRGNSGSANLQAPELSTEE
jgi:plasmid maintenance system killer protein